MKSAAVEDSLSLSLSLSLVTNNVHSSFNLMFNAWISKLSIFQVYTLTVSTPSFVWRVLNSAGFQ